MGDNTDGNEISIQLIAITTEGYRSPLLYCTRWLNFKIVGPLLSWSTVGPNACNNTKHVRDQRAARHQHSYLYVTDSRTRTWS